MGVTLIMRLILVPNWTGTELANWNWAWQKFQFQFGMSFAQLSTIGPLSPTPTDTPRPGQPWREVSFRNQHILQSSQVFKQRNLWSLSFSFTIVDKIMLKGGWIELESGVKKMHIIIVKIKFTSTTSNGANPVNIFSLNCYNYSSPVSKTLLGIYLHFKRAKGEFTSLGGQKANFHQ